MSYENEANVFYIGSSLNPNERLKSHKTNFGYLTIMHIVEEIEFENRDTLLYLERFWSDQFRQWGFDLKNKDCYKRSLKSLYPIM